MSNKVGFKFTRFQRAQRRAIIARLSLKIREQRDIAAELARIEPDLAVTDRQVGYDLRLAAKLWKKEYVGAVQTQKHKELQELLELRQITWDCLQRSIGKSRIVTKEGKPGSDGKVTNPRVVIKEEDLAGNPNLIAQLIEIDKQIRILMGLDAEKTFDLGSGVKITVSYADDTSGAQSEAPETPSVPV